MSIELCSAEGDFDKFMDSLPSLPRGEGWIWSPEFMGLFEKIKIRKRITFHPDREKIGDKFVIPQLDQIDVQSFITKFKTQIEKPKDKKIKDFTPEQDSVAEMIKEEATKDDRALMNLRNEYESQLIQKDSEIRKLKAIINAVQKALGVSQNEQVAVLSLGNETNMMLEKFGGMTKAIYETLLRYPDGLTKRQIALMCGYSVNGGSFSNCLSKLKTMGLIKKDGEIYRALLK